MVQASNNAAKALALANLGVKVFPVWRNTKEPAIPESEGGRGFLDATCTDTELISTWFNLDYPEQDKYAVGAWMGGSGLIALDIDQKNNKDGFTTLKENKLSPGDTYSHKTASGGEHRVFASDRVDVTIGSDVKLDGKKLEGVDIRAGGGYIVWWGDEIPETREAFSANIPEWIENVATAKAADFSGEGFSGTVAEWLKTVSTEVMPSMRVREFMGRIPKTDFGHPDMVELAWEIVRLASERESGIEKALEALRDAWLREPYNTPKYRKDLNVALLGAINKGGRIQKPFPGHETAAEGLNAASRHGVRDELHKVEQQFRSIHNPDEADCSRARREMFKIGAEAGMRVKDVLGVVAGSNAFKKSHASLDSVWFNDGEPIYHDLMDEAEEEPEPDEADAETPVGAELAEATSLMRKLSTDAEAFTFLDEAEQKTAEAYEWFGVEYLDWVKSRLKHFNRPYHVASMWAALSVIVAGLGKVPIQGADPMDTNLYFQVLGDSSSGKSEAWSFAQKLIDSVFGLEQSPIVADAKKATALSIHRTMMLRDGEPSMIISDEVQGFYKELQGGGKWQGSILSDMSDYYGGEVKPKNTMNDKEFSGKRAKCLLSVYFTGIAKLSFEYLNIDHWTDGFLFRFVWAFGHPRVEGDHTIIMETSTASYDAKFETWGKHFKNLRERYTYRPGGKGRPIAWEDDAIARMEKFSAQMEEATKPDPLHSEVFNNANGRFRNSIFKVATIIAILEEAPKVTLDHVLVALSFAGPWHRSMVLAVNETGKDRYSREVDRVLEYIRRNALRQVGKAPYVYRSSIMRAFRDPYDVVQRYLNQLVSEGEIIQEGDTYVIPAKLEKGAPGR